MATFVGGENLSAVLSGVATGELNIVTDITIYTVPVGSYALVTISGVSMQAGNLSIGNMNVSARLAGVDPDEIDNKKIRSGGVYIGAGASVIASFNTNTSNISIQYTILQYQVPA